MKTLINIISWVAFPVALAWSLKTNFDYEPLLALLASTIGIITTFNGGNQSNIRGRVVHNFQTDIAYVTRLINIIPFGKYVVSVLSFAIVIAIISALKLDNFKFNYLAFGAVFAFSILILVASKFSTSSDIFVKNSGRALIVVVPFLFILCACFLASSVFFDWPKRFCEYFDNCKEDTGFVIPQIDTCKVHILVSDYIDEDGKNGAFGKVIASEIEAKLERLTDSFPEVEKYINQITSVHEKVNKNNYASILKKYNADIIFYGTYVNPIEDTSKFYTNIFMDADFTQEYKSASNATLRQNDIFDFNLTELIGKESEKIIYYLAGTIVSGLDKCTAKELRDFSLAEALLKKSYSIETNKRFDVWVASTYFYVLQQIGKSSEAITIYTKLLSNKLVKEDEKALVYMQLGDIYTNMDEFVLAKESINKAILYSKMSFDTFDLVKSYNMMGSLLIHSDPIDSAKYYYDKALENKVYVDSNTLAKITNGLGMTRLIEKKYFESIEFFSQATKLYRNTNDLSGEVTSLANISQAYSYLDSLDLALKYATQALMIAENSNFKEDCARIYWQLSSIYRKRKDHKLSISFLHKCLKLLNELELDFRVPITEYTIAINYRELSQIDSCKKYLLASIKSSQKYDDPETLNLARTELKKNSK